uniref:(northern house mosquito) hypothetical protein n=1 Tax=Culex pipiens TaxID=7175 RepID=A0A8D8K081_CULPI
MDSTWGQRAKKWKKPTKVIWNRRNVRRAGQRIGSVCCSPSGSKSYRSEVYPLISRCRNLGNSLRKLIEIDPTRYSDRALIVGVALAISDKIELRSTSMTSSSSSGCARYNPSQPSLPNGSRVSNDNRFSRSTPCKRTISGNRLSSTRSGIASKLSSVS